MFFICELVVLNFTSFDIIPCIQRDFGGIAASLRNCCIPEDFPKTLIFCKTKAQCVKIFNVLTAVSAYKSLVSMYHANLSGETKASLYNRFASVQSDLRCLVCTIAFGMVSNGMRRRYMYTCTCTSIYVPHRPCICTCAYDL